MALVGSCIIFAVVQKLIIIWIEDEAVSVPGNMRESTATWVVVAVCAVIYYLTCCRTVFVGDSGELSLVLTTGGIAHPPGYPLYTILGYIWVKLLFFLRPAFAANLFSAAAAAASAGLLYRLLRRISRPYLPTIIVMAATLPYALALPVWQSAIAAEVYALSGLLFIAAIYAVIEFYHRGGTRRLILASLLSGLVMTHHFSAGVVIAALIMAIYFRRDSLKSSRILSLAGLAFVIPLTLYFYLLLRFDPGLPVNWLSGRSLAALLRVVAGANYQQYVGLPTIGDLFLFSRTVAVKLFLYLGPGLIVLAIPGIVFGFRRDVKLSILLVVPAVLNLLLVALYPIPDYDTYLIPTLVVAVIFIVLGLSWLYSARRVSTIAKWILAGIIVAVPFSFNFAKCNFSRFTLAERYGKDILDSAPKDAAIFLKSDNAGHTALYLRYAEDYRGDVAVYTLNSTVTRLMNTFGCRDLGDIMDSVNARNGLVCWGTEYIVNQGMNPSPGEKMVRGMLYVPMDTPDDPILNARIDEFTQNQLPNIDLRGDLKARQIYMEYALRAIERSLLVGHRSEAMQRINSLDQWRQRLHDAPTLMAGAQFFFARGLLDESLRWVDYARKTNPLSHVKKDIFVNLGTIYRQSGNLPAAKQALTEAMAIDADYEPARYNYTLVTAEMALRGQDWQTALDAFLDLTKLEPNNPLPYFNVAVIYEKMPDREEDALRFYQTFVTMAGNQYPQAVRRARARIDTLMAADTTLR